MKLHAGVIQNIKLNYLPLFQILGIKVNTYRNLSGVLNALNKKVFKMALTLIVDGLLFLQSKFHFRKEYEPKLVTFTQK